ncbi:1,4-dihydroxy-2-naphthoate polyprenyltransferase [Marinobacterium lacunae]|uniref:1,4-dihydroxy-2-naphthoate polyprenyltransferase n=1 Tax=Marinobacterium lacunae TaxID=1232683 RepID=A0A081FXH0_9GAMM|nr:prenyltransferase [Marinobacterium lacunae]KEA63225.1 1,4-dihydroxy-2-naphthoate polyprenyltransferase [Marinobacterium lacunae]MBR9882740.1 prenyltransferase [Oceanospirillales bacterium]
MNTIQNKYTFLHALRPFSFGVAVTTCLIGITAAWQEGVLIPLNALLVVIGGLLLQSGVNLINDYSDIELLSGEEGSACLIAAIRRNFRAGIGCFLLATPLGLYLVADRSMALLGLFALGLAGALGYTLNPVNYKSRGLAVVLVFWLMGVFMVVGSYVAVGGVLNRAIIAQSIPISLLVSLLLLSNELRDYESDRDQGLKTLTVRAGFTQAKRLYWLLMASTLIACLVLWVSGLLATPWPLLISLPFMIRPLRYLNTSAEQRRPLTPATGQLVMVFGLLFCFALN